MSERFAAVDLGSNSFRLEIARFEGTRLVSERYVKENVRLAGSFTESGELTAEIQEKALAALRHFALALRGFEPARVRAVGTQALRTAANAAAFLKRAERALGHPIRIISGIDEAELVFRGCVSTLPTASERRLVIDIGGASTELVTGRGRTVLDADSFPLGSVNVSARFFGDGTITRERFRRAIEYAAEIFARERHRFGGDRWESAFGAAGTIGAILLVARSEGWGEVITREVLALALDAFCRAGSADRLALRGMKTDRRDIISGGLAVLVALFDTLQMKELGAASGSLRTGLFCELKEAEHLQHGQCG